jgi:nucleoid-associated protein YgaU
MKIHDRDHDFDLGEPEDEYLDWDSSEAPVGPRVLWGRVVALVVVVVVAFLAGRATGGGPDQRSEIEQLRNELETTESELDDVRSQLLVAEASAGENDATAGSDLGADDESATDDGTAESDTTQSDTTDEGSSTADTTDEGSSTADTTDEGSSTADTAVEGETYEVQRNDSLELIATDAYGEADLYQCIAQANGLTTKSTITPGDELTIPPEEDC